MRSTQNKHDYSVKLQIISQECKKKKPQQLLTLFSLKEQKKHTQKTCKESKHFRSEKNPEIQTTEEEIDLQAEQIPLEI